MLFARKSFVFKEQFRYDDDLLKRNNQFLPETERERGNKGRKKKEEEKKRRMV